MEAVLERPKPIVFNKKKILELKKEKLRRSYPKLWLAKYYHLTTHLKNMQFGNRYRFLVDIYKDAEKYPVMCCRKSVQCGVTDFLVVCALDEASKGLRIFYVMPNQDLRNDFVKDRLDTLLRAVLYYNAGVREALGRSASIGLKHFYKGLLNFVGSRSTVEFTSYQADSLIIDEVDKCDQNNLAMAPDRMDASYYKHDRRVGNPSVENWGIDATYKKSTQGVWMVRCEHCNYWQELDFFKNVVEQLGEMEYKVILGDKENPKCVCQKCGKEIDRLGEGTWVHKEKSNRRGYTISQLFSANVTLASRVDKFFDAINNEVKLQLFYNSNLGLPYTSSGSKITLALLNKATEKANYLLRINDASKASGLRNLYVGIDVGKYFHVIGRQRLSNGMKKLVFVGKYATSKEVVDLLKGLGAKLIVIDEEPELHKVEEMKTGLKKMYSCSFQLGLTFLNIKKSAEKYKKEKRIKIDRTFILDCVKENYEKGIMINPSNAQDLGNEEMEEYGEYYQHLLASTRTYNADNNRFEWRESSPDHFFLCEAYCRMAEELDNKILDYYIDRIGIMEDKDVYEMEKEAKRDGEGIIPKTKEGKVDVEKLKLMNAQSFLHRLFYHTEDLMGKRVSHKRDNEDKKTED